jgi:CheY-like chemotaxis protein
MVRLTGWRLSFLGVKVAEEEKGVFDLVISDIGLPDGTGTQLMHTLKDRYNLRVRLPAFLRIPPPGLCDR